MSLPSLDSSVQSCVIYDFNNKTSLSVHLNRILRIFSMADLPNQKKMYDISTILNRAVLIRAQGDDASKHAIDLVEMTKNFIYQLLMVFVNPLFKPTIEIHPKHLEWCKTQPFFKNISKIVKTSNPNSFGNSVLFQSTTVEFSQDCSSLSKPTQTNVSATSDQNDSDDEENPKKSLFTKEISVEIYLGWKPLRSSQLDNITFQPASHQVEFRES